MHIDAHVVVILCACICASGTYSNLIDNCVIAIAIVDKNCKILRSTHMASLNFGWNGGEAYRSSGPRLTVKGTYHDGQIRFSVLSYRELTQSFLDLQKVWGADGAALDIRFSFIQLCFHILALACFPEYIRLCQKVLIKLMSRLISKMGAVYSMTVWSPSQDLICYQVGYTCRINFIIMTSWWLILDLLW